MPTTSRILLGAATALAVALVSCGGGRKEPPPDAAPATVGEPARPATTGGARTLPIPGHATTSGAPALPPGHPPIDPKQGAAGVAITPPPPGSGEGQRGLLWKVPSAWVEEPPSSGMRRAQYRVPGPAGDGECVVHYFGPNQGGDAMSNAVRWAGQFKQPDGRPAEQAMKTSKLDVAGIEVLEVEVTGTYAGGMTMTAAPAEDKPGSMLLGAIAAGPDANWFFKLTGPEATVKAQRAAFEGMLRSLRVGE